MLNNLSILGRLTKNPELKQTSNGISVCRFGIANDRTSGENKITDFFDVVAWRKTAEFIAKYFSKGDPIILQGRIETNEFTDRDGVTRKTVQIVVAGVDFAGGKGNAANSPLNNQNAKNGQINANNDTSDELPFPLEF